MTAFLKTDLTSAKLFQRLQMKSLFILLLITPAFTLAKSPEPKSEITETRVPVKEGYETMDMNQFKNLDGGTKSGKSGVSFTSSCTGKNGVQFSEGQTGYDGCLREAQMDNSIGNKNGATPNFGVQLGD